MVDGPGGQSPVSAPLTPAWVSDLLFSVFSECHQVRLPGENHAVSANVADRGTVVQEDGDQAGFGVS